MICHPAGIEPWTFEQAYGEAVFIPVGCPHQVRNLKVILVFLIGQHFSVSMLTRLSISDFLFVVANLMFSLVVKLSISSCVISSIVLGC